MEKEEDSIDYLLEGQGAKKNKYETAEVEMIQQEIQSVTKQIEHEKIKLRITDERLSQKKSLFQQLEGRGGDEKENRRKKRLNKSEAFRIEQKKKWIEIVKKENEKETLTKKVNETMLKIEELKTEIANLRKRKGGYFEQLVDSEKTNNDKVKETQGMVKSNKMNKENIEKNDKFILETEKKRGEEEEKVFNQKRDRLEDKYHEIIEANIQRQREKIKEQAMKRRVVGAIARQILNKEKNSAEKAQIDQQIKKIKDEEISDRIPILDVVLTSHLSLLSHLSQILCSFRRKAQVTARAFDVVKKILRVQELKQIPEIFSKSSSQSSEVSSYLCTLENQLDELEAKKKNLENNIKELECADLKMSVEMRNRRGEEKERELTLESQIKSLHSDIAAKREFFSRLQPMCDRFLARMKETYISEFVPNKVPLIDLKYNENNINQIFDNILNYYKILSELEVQPNSSHIIPPLPNPSLLNFNLSRLDADVRAKLDGFRFESLQKKIREEMKAGNSGKNGVEKSLAKLGYYFASQANGENIASSNRRKKEKEKEAA